MASTIILIIILFWMVGCSLLMIFVYYWINKPNKEKSHEFRSTSNYDPGNTPQTSERKKSHKVFPTSREEVPQGGPLPTVESGRLHNQPILTPPPVTPPSVTPPPVTPPPSTPPPVTPLPVTPPPVTPLPVTPPPVTPPPSTPPPVTPLPVTKTGQSSAADQLHQTTERPFSPVVNTNPLNHQDLSKRNSQIDESQSKPYKGLHLYTVSLKDENDNNSENTRIAERVVSPEDPVQVSKIPFGENTILRRGEDSISEMFSMMERYRGKILGANTTANMNKIGGPFTKRMDSRWGCTQEGGTLALFRHLFKSLYDYNTKDNPSNQDPYKYANPLDSYILFSANISPRIDIALFDEFIEYKSGGAQKFFTDFISEKMKDSDGPFFSNGVNTYGINFYTIAIRSRESYGDTVDYQKIERDVYLKIMKMLIHAKSINIEAMVITTPGSGVLSKTSNGEIDKNYLGCVEIMTFAAIRDFGGFLKEITLCGIGKERFNTKMNELTRTRSKK